MAIKIDPPKRIGITGDRTEYLISYLSELARQIEFELSVCHQLIESSDKRVAAFQKELEGKFNERDEQIAKINAEIAALQEQVAAMNTEEGA